jgi:cytochrome c oxidase cbb3-type subunit III
MSSRCRRASALALLAAALLAACEREERELKGGVETAPTEVTLTDLYAGAPAPPPRDPRARQYEGNAFHIAQGQRYFTWYNCSGCHANGGGGMGPALMDDEWRYGGEMEQIVSTVVQGRPNGMPSFREKIPDQQVWQIAAYVRSLSANTPKTATPSRPDAMQNTLARTQANAERPQPTDPVGVQGTAR